MGPLALLGCAALCTGLGRAEVVSDFTQCNQFFYGGKAPQGFDPADPTNICQKYKNKYHFATLYDKSSRIPVWSAYTLNPMKCKKQKPDKWMVEPQLSDLKDQKSLPLVNMMTEEQIEEKTGDQNVKEKLKQSQAIIEDYEKTGYDQGHLNPRNFQCSDSCLATFTLTNAAPQEPHFNRVRWCNLERNLKKQLTEKCHNENGKAFLVTGTVPNKQKKIPNNDNNRVPRVVVPSHFWTAVCCEIDNNKKFSFAFLGENEADSIPERMTVKELNEELRRLYGSNQAITIFNDCSEDGKTGKDISAAISKKLHSNLPDTDEDPCQTPGPSGAKRPKTK